MISDVNVYLLDFHSNKINEAVIPNEDGTYTILINARMASNKLLEAYKHALNHIKNNDFAKDDVQSIESNAHKFT